MIDNMLINKVKLFEKQITNEGGIRKETLNELWEYKGRLGWFYSSWDQSQVWVQKIVEDKRILYLEKWTPAKKGLVAKVDIEDEEYEILNVYKVQDMNWVHHLKCLVKTIK